MWTIMFLIKGLGSINESLESRAWLHIDIIREKYGQQEKTETTLGDWGIHLHCEIIFGYESALKRQVRNLKLN